MIYLHAHFVCLCLFACECWGKPPPFATTSFVPFLFFCSPWIYFSSFFPCSFAFSFILFFFFPFLSLFCSKKQKKHAHCLTAPLPAKICSHLFFG
jgi:hypothetical protein